VAAARAREPIRDSATRRLPRSLLLSSEPSKDSPADRYHSRHVPPLDTQTEILEPRPYSTEGAARDSAPEILEPSSCVAASGNESSRISTVRTSEPRFVLAQFLTFASAAEPPSFPRSLVRREQPQVDVNGHPPRSKSARSDSSRMGEQGTHLLLLEDRLKTRSGGESQTEFLEPPSPASSC
jgi:hypothetical protein